MHYVQLKQFYIIGYFVFVFAYKKNIAMPHR